MITSRTRATGGQSWTVGLDSLLQNSTLLVPGCRSTRRGDGALEPQFGKAKGSFETRGAHPLIRLPLTNELCLAASCTQAAGQGYFGANESTMKQEARGHFRWRMLLSWTVSDVFGRVENTTEYLQFHKFTKAIAHLETQSLEDRYPHFTSTPPLRTDSMSKI